MPRGARKVGISVHAHLSVHVFVPRECVGEQRTRAREQSELVVVMMCATRVLGKDHVAEVEHFFCFVLANVAEHPRRGAADVQCGGVPLKMKDADSLSWFLGLFLVELNLASTEQNTRWLGLWHLK